MAEVTGLRNNALPYPVYGAPFGIVVPILDNDGDLVTGAAGLDSEVSKNGNTFADCTNEATEIATSSGFYYLLLTATEMTADVVAVIIKTSTTDAKTTSIALYPRKLVTIRSATSASAGSLTSTIVLDGSASALDDFYNGMICIATIDSNVEARIISDYTGSSKSAAVVPDWNVAPDNNDTFVIALPEGVQLNQANQTAVDGVALSTHASGMLPSDVRDIAGSAVSTSTAQLGVNAVQAGGTAWASGSFTSGVFATGAITAGAIAADAIGASELAADAATEIGTAVWATAARTLTANTNFNDPTAATIAAAVWDLDATSHQTQGTFGQAIGDPVADTNTIFKAVVTDATGATVGVDGAAILAAVDTEVAAIKTKTDQLTFTTANRVDSQVFGMQAGTVTATAIATDAIDADALAADAIAEINATVDTALADYDGPTHTEMTAELATADDATLAAIAALNNLSAAQINTEVDTALADYDGPTHAEFTAELATADDAVLAAIATVDANVDDIKDKTDQLTFTVPGQVDANIESVNATTVDGIGTEADPWGPA